MNAGPQAMARAEAVLFAPAGLDDAAIGRTLGELAAGTDLADLYFQSRQERGWHLTDGKVSSGSFAITQGVGARSARDGRVAFAHSADPRPAALLDTARSVRAMRRQGAAPVVAGAPPVRSAATHDLYGMDPATGEDAAPWIALLQRIDALARDAGPDIVRVEAGLRAVDDLVVIADVDRGMAADIRPAIRLWLSVVAERDGKRAIWPRGPPRSVRCRSSSRPAIPVCCSTKRSATGWRAIITARRCRRSPGGSASASPRRA